MVQIIHYIIEDAYGGSSPHPHTSCSYCPQVMFSFVVAARTRNIKAAAVRAQGRNQFVLGDLGTSWRSLGAVLENKCKKPAKCNFSHSLLEAFFESTNRSGFFLEFYLLLPLRLLLKNAPKDTFGHTIWCRSYIT